MLSVRLNALRNLRCPAAPSSDEVVLRWAVKVVHGSQNYLTRFVDLGEDTVTVGMLPLCLTKRGHKPKVFASALFWGAWSW